MLYHNAMQNMRYSNKYHILLSASKHLIFILSIFNYPSFYLLILATFWVKLRLNIFRLECKYTFFLLTVTFTLWPCLKSSANLRMMRREKIISGLAGGGT